MINQEDLTREMEQMGRAYPETRAWIHQRGFDEEELNLWLMRVACGNVEIALTLDSDLLALSRSSLLVGLSVGYELGFRHGRELRA